MVGRIVVVGASLAGLRVAEGLRREGFDGELTLLGDEARLPYDRPPLSKQVLTGEWPAERVGLTDVERLSTAGITLVTGVRAVGVDQRSVRLADGAEVPYDELVVATGASPRRWPGAEASERVHTLRTLDDALTLREALSAGGPLVVVGGGFIGLEVAAAARGLGVEVTVVEAQSAPLQGVLGRETGEVFARLHRSHGVRLLTGTPITEVVETEDSVTVRLADGRSVRAAHAVVGIGATPNTGWLAGLGLDFAGGVPADASGRVAAHVWALGDAAAWVDAEHGDRHRHEHWTGAVDQAAVVVAAVLGGTATRPHEVAYFWSMQYDVNFQLVGRPDLATACRVAEPGDDTDRGAVIEWLRHDDVVAVGTVGNPRRLLRLRRELQVRRDERVGGRGAAAV